MPTRKTMHSGALGYAPGDMVTSRIAGPPTGGLLYMRVRERILHDLVSGKYAAGDKYYTEMELASRLKVCRSTVRKAVDNLAKEGFLSRHRRIGTIVESNPLSPAAPQQEKSEFNQRQRLILVLPRWNDTVEGFYTGKLLQAISSPDLTPRFSVEVRHHNDPVTDIHNKGAAVVIIDPDMTAIRDLLEMSKDGWRIIAIEPRQPIQGLVNLFSDKRGVVCQAVKRFYELGHEAVGMVNHNLGHLDYERSLLGYLDAHRELKRTIPHNGIVQYTAYHDLHHEPDVRSISAWVCTYMGSLNIVVEQCRLAGLSIPQDVSVISLDDPGDIVVASVGKKISVAASDPAAAAALIHTYVNDWRDDRRGTMTFIPSRWIDRQTVAPPRK